jgi:hypothetical protein
MPELFSFHNRNLFLNLDDFVPDNNIYINPPGNFCSYQLFIDNCRKGIYDKVAIDVFVNPDSIDSFKEYLKLSKYGDVVYTKG